jgi:hypothetical protein
MMRNQEPCRGEIAVINAGTEGWWVHSFDRQGESGQLLSSHRLKRQAVRCAARMARDLQLDLVIWCDQ